MNASQVTRRTCAPPLERRIRRMAKELGRGVDEVRNWLETAAAAIEAEEHFDSLDDPPYMLCLNGRLVCNGLEAWGGDTFRLYFTDNPADPSPQGRLSPRAGGWVPEPARVPAGASCTKSLALPLVLTPPQSVPRSLHSHAISAR